MKRTMRNYCYTRSISQWSICIGSLYIVASKFQLDSKKPLKSANCSTHGYGHHDWYPILLSVLHPFLHFNLPTQALIQETSKTKTSLHLPPSPTALLIIGHLHYLGPSLYKSLTKLFTKYGPLLYLKLGVSRCLVVSSASMANEIFKIHDLAFAERPSFPFRDKLPYGSSGFFVAPYGDQWRFIKKLCMTELLSAKQVEKSRVARHEEVVPFLLKVLESAKKKQTLDMSVEIMKLTNNSTFRLAMSMRSLDEPHEAERIRKLVKESNEVGAKAFLGDMFGPLSKLAFWLYGQRAIDVTLKYDEILERFLKQREEISNERENEDLMDLLLKAYRDDKSEFKINRIHLKAFLLVSLSLLMCFPLFLPYLACVCIFILEKTI